MMTNNEPEASGRGEAPERVVYGMCKRHGFCDVSHRCAEYDGESNLEYILRSTHEREVREIRRALAGLALTTESVTAASWSENDQLTAEVARLREALRTAAENNHSFHAINGNGDHIRLVECEVEACAAACTALNGKGEGE